MANVHNEILVLSDMISSSGICWFAAKSTILYRDTHEGIGRFFHRIHRYLCYCLRGKVS